MKAHHNMMLFYNNLLGWVKQIISKTNKSHICALVCFTLLLSGCSSASSASISEQRAADSLSSSTYTDEAFETVEALERRFIYTRQLEDNILQLSYTKVTYMQENAPKESEEINDLLLSVVDENGSVISSSTIGNPAVGGSMKKNSTSVSVGESIKLDVFELSSGTLITVSVPISSFSERQYYTSFFAIYGTEIVQLFCSSSLPNSGDLEADYAADTISFTECDWDNNDDEYIEMRTYSAYKVYFEQRIVKRCSSRNMCFDTSEAPTYPDYAF